MWSSSVLGYMSTRTDANMVLTLAVQGEWEAKGAESSTPFTAIDLSEGEWYDYDEKAGDEVSIKELKWEIVRA